MSFPGIASIFTPNWLRDHECITSDEVTIKNTFVFVGNIKCLSVFKSLKWGEVLKSNNESYDIMQESQDRFDKSESFIKYLKTGVEHDNS